VADLTKEDIPNKVILFGRELELEIFDHEREWERYSFWSKWAVVSTDMTRKVDEEEYTQEEDIFKFRLVGKTSDWDTPNEDFDIEIYVVLYIWDCATNQEIEIKFIGDAFADTVDEGIERAKERIEEILKDIESKVGMFREVMK